MKINYFAYCFEHAQTRERVLFDLRDFMKGFCSLDDPNFKNGFKFHDENLYLFPNVEDVFLFLVTRSGEVIQKINSENLSVSEISSLFSENEKLGFASYIIMDKDHFGFASKMWSPKVDIFANYINQLLVSLGIKDWMFIPHSLLYQATKDNAIKLPYIGKTVIEMDKSNSFMKDLFGAFGISGEDTVDFGSIELMIKPVPRKNIKPTVKKFLQNISDEGVQKMMLKAKDETMSSLTDIYIVGQGAISDRVSNTRVEKIPDLMYEKKTQNELLSQKLAEYLENGNLQECIIEAIAPFNSPDCWSDRLSRL